MFVVSSLGTRKVLQATVAAARRLSERAVTTPGRRSARSQARLGSNAVQPLAGGATLEFGVVRVETAQ